MKLGYITIRLKPKQWTERGNRLQKKAKSFSSVGKVLATVFWDSHGVILIDYFQKGKTITGAYYALLLNKLKVKFLINFHIFIKRKSCFTKATPPHTSTVAMAKIHEFRFERLEYLSCSPDLTLRDLFLFPQLKTALGGQRFFVK